MLQKWEGGDASVMHGESERCMVAGGGCKM